MTDNQWLKMSEVKPVRGQLVYVYSDRVQSGRSSGVADLIYANGTSFRYDAFTHWMPRELPEPPKEGT